MSTSFPTPPLPPTDQDHSGSTNLAQVTDEGTYLIRPCVSTSHAVQFNCRCWFGWAGSRSPERRHLDVNGFRLREL